VAPLAATRTHIELYRASMEERGLAASTVDRRLSTVCGYYRFAHLDGRIPSNPALHVRRPAVHPTTQRGTDRGELAAFLYSAERISPIHAALAVLLGLNGLRISEACSSNIEDLGFERGHRTLRILGKGNRPAVVPLVPRTTLGSSPSSAWRPWRRRCGYRSSPRTSTRCSPSATRRRDAGRADRRRPRPRRVHDDPGLG
jgi:integrase